MGCEMYSDVLHIKCFDFSTGCGNVQMFTPHFHYKYMVMSFILVMEMARELEYNPVTAPAVYWNNVFLMCTSNSKYDIIYILLYILYTYQSLANTNLS